MHGPVSRRSNVAARCPRCRLHQALCVCQLIPRVETRTRLTLVIHHREDDKTTNTGRLASECLPNSQVLVRGHAHVAVDPLADNGAAQPVLLFPHEDARPLGEFAESAAPVHLIVPDGNWRQAAKVRARVPGLSQVPCATLPAGAPTLYRLRSEPHEGGLATMEAIARAFGILEGPHVQQALEQLFLVMVERTLWSRGQLAAEHVHGGVPRGNPAPRAKAARLTASRPHRPLVGSVVALAWRRPTGPRFPACEPAARRAR